ncbi:MAG: arginine deiminase [Defluviitaleaceae bacterium]|nr:arginine deiminase [Defluviitaleaceae bacterium]
MSKPINVNSEIGKLKKVMVHRPGDELSEITPENSHEMLFEDVIFVEQAQREHDGFVNTLRSEGVEVVYLVDLAAEALETSPQVRQNFINEFVEESGSGFDEYFKKQVTTHFETSYKTEKELVLATMSGITFDQLNMPRQNGALSKLRLPKPSSFVINPMPNLYFTRDPFSSIGNNVAISRMWSAARNRETIFSKYIFAHHPHYAQADNSYYYERHLPSYVEGGDILLLDAQTMAVGISQRTYPEGIELLAEKIFADEKSAIKNVLVLEIPKQRNCMHLDTIFTQLDVGKFLIYEKYMGDLIHAYAMERGNPNAKDLSDWSLKKILDTYLKCDAKFIKCGGDNPVHADREQWNDGANVLTLAPGRVIAYDRNPRTNDLLRKELGEENVLTFASGELSRGRGGPRCMSMPLLRQDLEV